MTHSPHFRLCPSSHISFCTTTPATIGAYIMSAIIRFFRFSIQFHQFSLSVMNTEFIRPPLSNIHYPTSIIQHPLSNIQYPTSSVQKSTVYSPRSYLIFVLRSLFFPYLIFAFPDWTGL
ncbi:hypothetical protein BU24DRAFT_416962 [Aaosphaeria arxii CBS 175.79]|uniref:Uncharacterized protein n=1 Tax=Aaosphaeria arxii CBS 175.79 TaxID=1450172 RepID=A0A6A5Y6Z0_9PLEO|nr:uncharacterized protein BU24DRAFT_416962 [Aaosphaeria arxii CBS 175.79]KAF2021298.1 hypothetical protein BU24DRAFT_416962 [Aaosphaeria arxii CBS 175.79]